MKEFKAIITFLTAMTMTIGAMGVTAYAEDRDSGNTSHPVDVSEEFEGIRGDIDSDGQITMHDANLLARYLRENVSEKLTAKADFNMDGYVNVRDAAMIAMELYKKGISTDNGTGNSSYHYPVDVNEEFEGIRGDMNGDGEVTLRDATLIAKYLHDDDYEKLTVKADYNTDGYVNVRDAAKIAKEIMTSGIYGDKQMMFGDADLSGNVDLADLTAISKYNLNSKAFPLLNELAFVNADVNYDDKVDSLDMTAMINMQLQNESILE